MAKLETSLLTLLRPCLLIEPAYGAVCWQVTQFYTAPTLVRALIGAGDEHVKKNDLSSLKILGSVGEPINPTAWHWLNEVRRRSFFSPFTLLQ